MKKKTRKKNYKIEVSCTPDGMSRTIRISCKAKISREEFLMELIDYIERQTDVTEDMLFKYMEVESTTIH